MPETGKFICFYQEGKTGRDNDGYDTHEYDQPELKRFDSMAGMDDWISERELDEKTSPKNNWGESYLFMWHYKGKEEYGEES